jgi:elongation factor G
LDTPGHVDFTVEVERSVRVLDAAVVLFDAVAGVQAQSETVWRQAARYGVPRLVFANKMDREGASVERLMSQLRTRLGATPLLLQVPIGSGSDFRGVVDLVSMRRLLWQDPHSGRLQADDLRPDTDPRLHHQASQAREQLVHATPEKQSSCSDAGQVETLAGLDDAVLEAALAGNVSAEILRAGLARALRQDRAVLCLLGSALRNRGIQVSLSAPSAPPRCRVLTRGPQPLLDAVVSYAPSPLDRPAPRARQLRTKGKELREPREVRVEASETGPLVALAFKVQHDPARGLVAYLRVYRGRLQSGTSVLNVSRNKRERIQVCPSLPIPRLRRGAAERSGSG